MYVFFGKCLFRSSAHFLIDFFDISCLSSFYILDINSLLDVLFANIFSIQWGSFFILLMISFAVQFFSLMQFHLFIFAFVSLVQEDRYKKEKNH